MQTSTLKFARATDSSAFSEFRTFIRAQFGIDLPENKESFVTSRMRKIVEGQGYSDFNQFMRAFLANPNPEQLSLILDQISTNHTFFFREPTHFMCLRQTVLPECRRLVDRDRLKQLRVWSSACSTGEEPYSIMMTLVDELGPQYVQYSPQLLATDINSEVLESARAGTFPKKNTVLVPAELRAKFLTESGGRDVVRADLKRDITFRRFNLMTPEYPFRNKFHIIFCRNVMIYFDPETTAHVVSKLYDALEVGGFLFVGESESIRDREGRFDYVQASVYRKIG